MGLNIRLAGTTAKKLQLSCIRKEACDPDRQNEKDAYRSRVAFTPRSGLENRVTNCRLPVADTIEGQAYLRAQAVTFGELYAMHGETREREGETAGRRSATQLPAAALRTCDLFCLFNVFQRQS